MRFNKLDVPYQWKDEFTKYPHGYTIFEALCKWTKQVDEMVDNVNDWNDYLDNFVENFEFELQKEVQSTITRWQNEGLLDEIIASALNTELDNVNAELAETVKKGDLMINVKDFGAVGDGITDDTTSIQEALEEGGDIYFPEGDYVISSVRIYSNTKITTHKNTTILFDDNTDRTNTPATIWAYDSTNITIDGVKIKAKNSDVHAVGLIYFEDCADIIIQNCVIDGMNRAEGEGIRTINCYNVKIDNNEVCNITYPHPSNNRASAIRCRTSKNVSITNNYTHHVNRHGIGLADGCEFVWIKDNLVEYTQLEWLVEDARDGAIDCYSNDSNIVIENNIIQHIGASGTVSSGIRLSGSKNVTLNNNTIYGSPYMYYFINITTRPATPSIFSKNITVIGNTLYHNFDRDQPLIHVRHGMFAGNFNFINNTIEGEGRVDYPAAGVVWVHIGCLGFRWVNNTVNLPNLTTRSVINFNTNSPTTTVDGVTYTVTYKQIEISGNKHVTGTASRFVQSDIPVENCVITNNYVEGVGSAIRLDSGSKKITFANNIIHATTDPSTDIPARNPIEEFKPDDINAFNHLITYVSD